MRSQVLALPVLRTSIGTCNACFSGSQTCRHHEDAVGGYGKHRIVLIGINPQGSDEDPVYEVIEARPWQERNLLGDRILDLFVAERNLRAGAKATPAELRDQLRRKVEEIFPEAPGLHAVPFDRHKGLRTWLPCVAERLGCAPEALRDHVTMVESIKHTTADEKELSRLRKRGDHPDLLVQCRQWLEQQLAHIEPRGVIFTGNSGVELAHALGALGLDDPATIGLLHGEVRRWRASPEAQTVDVLFSYAFSGQTKGVWRRHAGSERVRRWFADRVLAPPPRPLPPDL